MILVDQRLESAIYTTMSSGSTTIRDLVPAAIVNPGKDGHLPAIGSHYSKVGESLRYNTPTEMQCSMFCGGRRCKYESSSSWKADDMAVEGIYSHWITDDLLAMARPNAQGMEKFKLIEQFQKLGIRSVFNLQTTGEHASCGPKLLSTGFTYDPNEFMRNDIFFYNFAWKDYADTSVPNLLDMVKVIAFAVSEGKVAVHCHAGLGRTGVLAAAYLVYHLRVRANDAIRYVRLKRPGSVQTRRQIQCVKEFEAYFLPQCLVFSSKPLNDPDKKLGRFTIEQYLKRQKHVLHGIEARVLKHIPKIIFKLCERILRLCNSGPTYDFKDGLNFTKSFLAHSIETSKSSGSRVGRFTSPSSASGSPSTNILPSTTPMDSVMATRWSSQSQLTLTDDESLTSSTQSSGYPTPSYGGTRPASETNSCLQSCSSALSAMDDGKLDDILADGIKNQTIDENLVTHELTALDSLQKVAASENLPKYDSSLVVDALLEPHSEIIGISSGKNNPWSSPDVLLLDQYRSSLNYKVSAWDRIDTESNLWVLAAMLFEWLEHLKLPILGKDNITYLVIHCDNLEVALKKLPSHVCFILEYLIRFVVRLKPIEKSACQDVMRRILVALTHQSISINGITHPVGKKFPKLRGGTAESSLKFLIKFYDFLYEGDESDIGSPDLITSHRLHQMAASDYEEESQEAILYRNASRASAKRPDSEFGGRSTFSLNQSVKEMPKHEENGVDIIK